MIFSLVKEQSVLITNFIELAFKVAGYNIYWEGSGINEVGKCFESNDVLVYIDPYYFRPTEVEVLQGDPLKAEKILGWKAKTKFKELVKLMMEFELKKN